MKIYRSADVIKFRETIGFVIKRKQEVLERVQQNMPIHRRVDKENIVGAAGFEPAISG